MDPEAQSESGPTVEDSDRVDLTCHAAIFTITENQLSLLLAERNEGPFRFQWELPGVTPEPDEKLAVAARQVRTPLLNTASSLELQQLGTYGDPDRDPRHRAIAVVYWGVTAESHPQAEPSEGRLVAVDEFTSDDFRFAFDHAHIAVDALNALRMSLTHTSTATRLCEPEFTMSELQHTYEVVFGKVIAAGNFHRKVRNTPGFVEPVGNPTQEPTKRGRPAQRFKGPKIVDVSPPFEFNISQ